MFRFILSIILFGIQCLSANLVSRENDPASFVENVSTINGDYTELEIDLTIPAPDSLIISRFYSSKDNLQTATFGGWRFNQQCFLRMQKDPKNQTYKTSEGTFEKYFVYVGDSDGSMLTYTGWINLAKLNKRISFHLEPRGIVNTSRGDISCWTNLKNNELYYDPQKDNFELYLCSEGKRFYTKIGESYLLTNEILPSGNKIFYEFDKESHVAFIKETNACENKELAWVKFEYGDDVYVETSDGKTAEYQFQKNDSSDIKLLTHVTRSNKPEVTYQYLVRDNHALLVAKDFPEGRFVQIDYDAIHRVKSIVTPNTSSRTRVVCFAYGKNYTEVTDSGDRKSVYKFNEYDQLTAIEQYLNCSLYRVHKKSWGTRGDNFGNLLSSSVEDAEGNVFYHKYFVYDDIGNVCEEHEYGDFSGKKSSPIIFDENGLLENRAEHIKYCSYFSGKDTHGFFQKDSGGSGVKYWYKKGTNLLIKKFILTNGSAESENESCKSEIKQRYFYFYNEDAALVKLIVDDGVEVDLDDLEDVTERRITNIIAKQELPNVGAPEAVEQMFTSERMKSEVLLGKTLNHFDVQGNVISQDIYDAEGVFRYSINKSFKNGLVAWETDPIGNETNYSYDANHNLVEISCSDTGISTEYIYDLGNRITRTIRTDKSGNSRETQIMYDSAGYKSAEVDEFGNETIYTNDSLGRPMKITYPEVSNGVHSSIEPTYTYAYDLFDNPISVTDPLGRTIIKSYNIKGKIAEINYLDGSQELFRYDSGGNLQSHYSRDKILEVFDYDYLGRVENISYYPRHDEDFEDKDEFQKKYFGYSAFHKISEKSYGHKETVYSYARGNLSSLKQGDRKVDFLYDSLGRLVGVKKWKSENSFTLEIKELDFLDRVIEERVEDSFGKVLTKTKFIYNDFGKLSQVIGYPQNIESILMQYDYDGFGRLTKTTNATGDATQFFHDDLYVNEWGQKGQKRTQVNSKGIQTIEIVDNGGNLIQTIKKDKSENVLSSFKTSYDCFGDKILEGSQNIAYERQNGRLMSIVLGKNTENQTDIKFEYDVNGQIGKKYSPGFPEPISYAYDNRANLAEVSYKEDGKLTKIRLEHNRDGLLTRQGQNSTQGAFSVDYEYNSDGLLFLERTKDEFGVYEVNRTYDGEGKIKTLGLPDGSLIEYDYEGPFVQAIFRLKKNKKEMYNYRVASRDLMGNILEEILPGSCGARIQNWDEAGRRTEIITDFFRDRAVYDQSGYIKKREVVYDGEAETLEYAYDDLGQLTTENFDVECTYTYDSIGNRLKSNNSVYEVNSLNQLVKAEGASYTFHLNGNLASKIVGPKAWTYKSNPLGQIVSIEDPNQKKTSFIYDLAGRRLSKRMGNQSKKPKVLRFFYLNNTEIGSLDEKGNIIELKVPSDPNNPEAPCIAIELKKEIYVPMQDLQNNVACLVSPQNREIVETYRYSAYGEEWIEDSAGQSVTDSKLDNPWRYHSKRIDKETGLVWFGFRYYDPEIGRWISPDPAWTIDGCNLYTYVHNNPNNYTDHFGLLSEDEPCKCGYCVRNEGYCHCLAGIYDCPDCGCLGINCVHKHHAKFGSGLKSRVGGIAHGAADFVLLSLYDLQTSAIYMGSDEMNIDERTDMIEVIEQSQTEQMASIDDFLMDILYMDASDPVYQNYRSRTTIGLEVASLISGGYGLVKGVMAFNKLAKIPREMTKIAKNISKISENPLQGTRYTQKVLRQMQPTLKTGYPDFHGFPRIVDNYANLGAEELICGRDGVNRLRISLKGGYQELDGHFEWIIEADKSINHRLFVVDP